MRREEEPDSWRGEKLRHWLPLLRWTLRWSTALGNEPLYKQRPRWKDCLSAVPREPACSADLAIQSALGQRLTILDLDVLFIPPEICTFCLRPFLLCLAIHNGCCGRMTYDGSQPKNIYLGTLRLKVTDKTTLNFAIFIVFYDLKTIIF